MSAVSDSQKVIERALGKSPAFQKVEESLYVVRQGSSYVMVSVVPTGKSSQHDDKAIVRVVANVASGVRPEASLFRQLLILNGRLRFGAFAYVPEGDVIVFHHSMLGGSGMDEKELIATVHDVALVADEYDDRIVARYGGSRMQDMIERNAMQHLFGTDDHGDLLERD
jgi:hypothetical protein